MGRRPAVFRQEQLDLVGERFPLGVKRHRRLGLGGKVDHLGAVGIGIPAAVGGGVPACEPVSRQGEAACGQVARLSGDHRKRGGRSRNGRACILRRVGVEGHRVARRPLRVQRYGGAVGQGEVGHLGAVGVERPAAVRCRVPAGESVAVPSKRAGVERARLVAGHLLIRHLAFAAVGVEGDGVGGGAGMGGKRDRPVDRHARQVLGACVESRGRDPLAAPSVEHVAVGVVGAAVGIRFIPHEHDAFGDAGAADPRGDPVTLHFDPDGRVFEGQRGGGAGFHGHRHAACRQGAAVASAVDVHAVGAGLDVFEVVRSRIAVICGKPIDRASAGFGDELDRAFRVIEFHGFVVACDGQRDGVARPLRGQRVTGKASVFVDLAKVHHLRLVGVALSRRIVAPVQEDGASWGRKRVGVKLSGVVKRERLRCHLAACALAAFE